MALTFQSLKSGFARGIVYTGTPRDSPRVFNGAVAMNKFEGR
jgi:hypothetical protein